MNDVHPTRDSFGARLRCALRAFLATLGKIEVAIALSEAGDVEGAKVLLGKPGAHSKG